MSILYRNAGFGVLAEAVAAGGAWVFLAAWRQEQGEQKRA
jgi:hypothetical protein